MSSDFEKSIRIRIEKAAERTLAERLNSVDWERIPVKKAVGWTVLAILAYKLSRPAWRFITFAWDFGWGVLALLVVFGIGTLWAFANRQEPPKTAGVDRPVAIVETTPVPRAELVHLPRHHR